jgi:hypothetical protein
MFKYLQVMRSLAGGAEDVNINNQHFLDAFLTNRLSAIRSFARSENRSADESALGGEARIVMPEAEGLKAVIGTILEHMKARGAKSLKMINAFLSKPTGKEKGTYYGIDFGGNNLRIVKTVLDGKGGIREEVILKKPIPAWVWKCSREEHFGWIADQLIEATRGESGEIIAGAIKQTLGQNAQDKPARSTGDQGVKIPAVRPAKSA